MVVVEEGPVNFGYFEMELSGIEVFILAVYFFGKMIFLKSNVLTRKLKMSKILPTSCSNINSIIVLAV